MDNEDKRKLLVIIAGNYMYSNAGYLKVFIKSLRALFPTSI